MAKDRTFRDAQPAQQHDAQSEPAPAAKPEPAAEQSEPPTDPKAGVAADVRLTEPDQRNEPNAIDELTEMASGHGGALPTDHDTTTTVEGHLGDADLRVTVNEGRNVDGQRGEGWTGSAETVGSWLSDDRGDDLDNAATVGEMIDDWLGGFG